MSTQRYSVTPQPIDVLLAWVKAGEIAIPEVTDHCELLRLHCHAKKQDA